MTMRMEGDSAIVHTGADPTWAMLFNKLCIQESVEQVNVVRKLEQEALLRGA